MSQKFGPFPLRLRKIPPHSTTAVRNRGIFYGDLPLHWGIGETKLGNSALLFYSLPAFTASLRSFPTLKKGSFFALILVSTPVLGFLPV